MQNFLVPILVQNKDFIAVDKPAGISVHNVEEKENLFTILQRELGISHFYPVHRLDKETSGVQILALNEVSAKKLSEEFSLKTVTKMYTGILRGEVKEQSGVWTNPLSDKAEGRKNPEGKAQDRVACETRFRVQKTSRYFSLCEFHLITGRQHQIRKHCALHKHAIVGDTRYNDPTYNKKILDLYKNARMFLHCHSTQILGYKIEAPLPVDFMTLFN